VIVVLYVIALLIGISLGLLGAGGAIVAVPAFVYIHNVPPVLASGYALFVVAVPTLIGSLPYIRRKQVEWRAVAAFGSTTLISIALVRAFVLPNSTFTAFGLDHDTTLMIAFAGILFVAGTSMLLRNKLHRAERPQLHPFLLALLGILVGVISGFLGVGGGFLMTPALVMWAGLDMKTAVGTSLVLICANSVVGVLADAWTGLEYDWPLVLVFTALATIGIIIGSKLSKRIHGATLQSAFGWFVVVIGIAVLVKEILEEVR